MNSDGREIADHAFTGIEQSHHAAVHGAVELDADVLALDAYRFLSDSKLGRRRRHRADEKETPLDHCVYPAHSSR